MNKPLINIERASESTIKALIKLGIIYMGDDDKLHVVDSSKSEVNRG